MSYDELNHLIMTEVLKYESKVDYTTYIDDEGHYVELWDFCLLENLDRCFVMLAELELGFFQLNSHSTSGFECLLGDQPIVSACSGWKQTPGEAIVTSVLRLKGVLN